MQPIVFTFWLNTVGAVEVEMCRWLAFIQVGNEGRWNEFSYSESEASIALFPSSLSIILAPRAGGDDDCRMSLFV